ncbi:MAG: phosphoglycerate kinase [Actinomycetota bacterium]|nr:phosphoglycerate kinase [Actinomycetota bacterium]MDA8207627.1 phosphoglycerate kinase [Actinomycetota bacterium]
MKRIPVLEDLGKVKGKRVLVRSDLNVPLAYAEDGTATIVDDFRIRASLPTIEWLLAEGAKVTVCSHIGRPKGQVIEKYSMKPVRDHLRNLHPEVEVLENLRFDAGEEGNDPAFVAKLIEGQDAYVDDAFGASHRAHASIVGPPKFLPSAAGRLLAAEYEVLSGLLDEPVRPFVAIIGGAKVSDKLALIEAMLPKVDSLLIGGAMAYTFFAAQGLEVGDSLFEPDRVEACRRILEAGSKVLVPVDSAVLPSDAKFGRGESGPEPTLVSGSIPASHRGLDIGPATIELFSEVIAGAATILWNGPMGVFEDPRLSKGTFAIARAVAGSRAFSVVGGGDSAAAVDEVGVADEISHLSTGGGASLELLEKGDLPGLAALREAVNFRD